MSDKRAADSIAGAHITGQIDTIVSWKPVVTSATDYYPFGMQMPGRYTSDTATHCFEMTQTKLVPYFYSQYFSMTSLPFVVNPYSATLTSTPGGDLRMSTAVGYVTIDIDSLVPGYSQTLSMVETGATATFDVSVLCLGSVVGSTVMNSPGTYNITFTPTTPTATIKIQRQFAGTPARYIQFSGMYLPRSDSSTLENVVTTICNGDKYQYGYNGKLKDNEWAGVGNHYDYGARHYDPRVARFSSVDPLAKQFPWNSSYAFAENDPISNIDLDGLEKVTYVYNFTADKITKTKIEHVNAGPLGNGVLVKSNFGGNNSYFYGNELPNKTLPAFKASYEGTVKDKDGNHIYYTNDGKGIPTIGYGHRIQPSDPYKVGSKITEAEAVSLFNKDQKQIFSQADKYLKAYQLTPTQKEGLYDLSFNGGPGKVQNYKEDGSRNSGEFYFLKDNYLNDVSGNVKRRYADNLLYSEGLYLHLDKVKGQKSKNKIENFLNPPAHGDKKK